MLVKNRLVVASLLAVSTSAAAQKDYKLNTYWVGKIDFIYRTASY